MDNFLAKLIPKNIAGIIGLVEAAFSIIRELLMVATRVCAIFIPGDRDDKIIAKIRVMFEKADDFFEEIKDFFLSLTDG